MEDFDELLAQQMKVMATQQAAVKSVGENHLDLLDRAIMQQAMMAEIKNPQADQVAG